MASFSNEKKISARVSWSEQDYRTVLNKLSYEIADLEFLEETLIAERKRYFPRKGDKKR